MVSAANSRKIGGGKGKTMPQPYPPSPTRILMGMLRSSPWKRWRRQKATTSDSAVETADVAADKGGAGRLGPAEGEQAVGNTDANTASVNTAAAVPSNEEVTDDFTDRRVCIGREEVSADDFAVVEDDPMPHHMLLRRGSSNSITGLASCRVPSDASLGSGRRGVDLQKVLDVYLSEDTSNDDGRWSGFGADALATGVAVNVANVRQNLAVVRGPAWCWSNEDGGPGQLGDILSFDQRARTVTVRWRATGDTYGHYRIASTNADAQLHVAPAAVAAARAPASPTGRRNSQMTFADPGQCVIILDWDDTLFPTTYVRHDLCLKWNKSLMEQDIPYEEKCKISEALARCGRSAAALLQLADMHAKVVIVSLAKSPWVAMSCDNFYPEVGELLKRLNVSIIYAQEGVQADYSKTKMMATPELEQFWSNVKSQAIAKELNEFYSKYEGQSWKNIISIGDSDFERLGTRSAIYRYLKMKGLSDQQASVDQPMAVEITGQTLKVRSKTFKLVDEPTAEELGSEMALLTSWLVSLVNLDASIDINLEQVDNLEVLRSIERAIFAGASPCVALAANAARFP